MAEEGEIHFGKIQLALQLPVGQIFHLPFDPFLEEKWGKNENEQKGNQNAPGNFQGFFHYSPKIYQQL